MAKAERLAIMHATSDARTTKVAKKLTKVSRRKVGPVPHSLRECMYICSAAQHGAVLYGIENVEDNKHEKKMHARTHESDSDVS
jgi:hypothetical protein